MLRFSTFVLAAAVLMAQTGSSRLQGILTDPANALIPSATVTVTAQATGAVSTAQSNETGLFRVLDLRPGRYNVHIEAPGFKAQDIREINLASAELRDLGTVTLQIGSVTEEISVTAAATPVQTASSERSARSPEPPHMLRFGSQLT